MSKKSQCVIKRMINSTTSEKWQKKLGCLKEQSSITICRRISFSLKGKIGQHIGQLCKNEISLMHSHFLIVWQRLLVFLALMKSQEFHLFHFSYSGSGN